MYTFKIFETITEECKNIWKSGENKMSSTFFQDIGYIEEVIKNNNSKVKIVVVYYKKIVIAILPLEIKDLLFIRVLQWIGTEFSDYCNPILSKNFKSNFNKKDFLSVWNLILNEMKDELDLVFLNNQLALVNGQPNPFVECLESQFFSKIYCIEIGSEFLEYKESIKKKNKKHAYEIHRIQIKQEKLKKLSEHLNLDIKESSRDNIDFNKIVDEKKKQLYKKNISNKLNKNFKKIFNNLIISKKKNFYLISLVYENKVLSKCFGFVYANTFYYYIPVVLPNSFNNYKPGKILIIQLIEWCIQNKIAKFDFGLGNEKYKKYFSNKEISLHRYLNFFSLRGLLAYSYISVLLKIKKLWL